MALDRQSAGDVIPPAHEVIEIRLAELKQLFNSIDPSPFGEKDLDPKAEEFIVNWAREVPANAPLALLVHLDRPAGLATEPAALRGAVKQFFTDRSRFTRQRLRQLFRVGRTSLVIGIAFLALSVVLGEVIESALGGRRVGELVREGLLIGGWVAMWRPIEIFLYEWWPIRAEARLFDRLSGMPLRILYDGSDTEAWRRDWPAVSPLQIGRDCLQPGPR